MRHVLFAALALTACKREDPHRVPPAEITQAAAGTVPAGSLLDKHTEEWMAVLLPEPPTEAQLLEIQAAARKTGVEVDPPTPPTGRWIEIHPSTPREAGFAAGDERPNLRGIGAADVPKLDAIEAAVVLGAGGPVADVDASRKDLAMLAYAAAVAGDGWILDEQTYAAYSPAAFADGPMRTPRGVRDQITIYVHDNGDETVTLTTGGLARFGLPELRTHVDTTGEPTWTDALDDAAQVLIDHGGLDTDGILQGADVRWSASWAPTAAQDGRLIELTPS